MKCIVESGSCRADLKQPAASRNYWDFPVFIEGLVAAKEDLSARGTS